MKAMIFAAGLGTRLRPLTDARPKALVEVGGTTLLERTLSRLREVGVRDVIINVHHFADMIAGYLSRNGNFGMRVELSREEALLDTGGGLKKAAHFFLQEASAARQPFFIHNVDVISTIDLDRMLRFHTEHQALAALAVQERVSPRYLLFDQQQQLCGRQLGDDATEMVRPCEQAQRLAFSGIHVVSPNLLLRMTQTGAFSIIDTYLQLAAEGERIVAFRADQYYWRDVGTPEHLKQAADELARQGGA